MRQKSDAIRWSKWWWQDWKSDPALRSCSSAARGVWMDMLCIAATGTKYGFVTINGRAATPRQLAGNMGETVESAEALIAELEEAQVFSRFGDPKQEDCMGKVFQEMQDLGLLEPGSIEKGTIYSRRMVRDWLGFKKSMMNGKKGGNPSLTSVKLTDPPVVTPTDNPPETTKAEVPEKKSSKKAQTTFLPPSPYETLKDEGFPLLSDLLNLPMDSRENLASIAKHLSRMWEASGKDADAVLSILRDTAEKPPREPISWIMGQIKAKCKPRLVVDNDQDPNDPRGIDAWCRSLPGVHPTESEREKQDGKWVYGNHIVDYVATQVASAARFPYAARIDWNLLQEWLDAGINPTRQIVPTIKRLAAHFTEPATSLKAFDGAVRERQAA